MGLLEFSQLSLMPGLDVVHFSVLELLPQYLYLPLEAFRLDVLAPRLAIFLPRDGLFSASAHGYIN